MANKLFNVFNATFTNGQRKKEKRTNNDVLGITYKTKDRVTQTH
jgi:hypothetical protein